jgi:hypothetical protein
VTPGGSCHPPVSDTQKGDPKRPTPNPGRCALRTMIGATDLGSSVQRSCNARSKYLRFNKLPMTVGFLDMRSFGHQDRAVSIAPSQALGQLTCAPRVATHPIRRAARDPPCHFCRIHQNRHGVTLHLLTIPSRRRFALPPPTDRLFDEGLREAFDHEIAPVSCASLMLESRGGTGVRKSQFDG